jgi:hypothetical protein
MHKSDSILLGIAGAIYFGALSAFLAYAADAGATWEAIAGLAGALVGAVFVSVARNVFGDPSRKGWSIRRRFYLSVVTWALLFVAFATLQTVGAGKLTTGLACFIFAVVMAVIVWGSSGLSPKGGSSGSLE